MNRIFDPDNFLFRWVSRIFDVMCLSIIWFGLSLPVFTLGASTTALYDAVVKCVRRRGTHPYARFWETFKANFKVGCLATLPGIVLVVLLAVWYVFFAAMAAGGTQMGEVIFVGYQLLCLVPIGFLCYLFPTLSRFTFGVKDLWATSFRLAMGHLLSTVAMGVVVVLSVQLTWQLIFPVFFLPGIVALIASLFLERVFKPFLPETADPEAPTDEALNEPPEEYHE